MQQAITYRNYESQRVRLPASCLPVAVAYAPTSINEEEEEVEAFYMDLKKFYREDRTFYKVIIGRERKDAKFTKRTPRTIIDWELFASLVGFRGDAIMGNIDDEYERLLEHLHDCTKKANSIKTTKRRPSDETLELIRRRGAPQGARNHELTSGLARSAEER
ncbi:hypothetical protein RB195_022129 [Necator americanus]|uniref:Uncharacterized protein n=1 Tax=Necator americanus TaxID=51031 RepID=A0ABR1EEQ6_NECAM